MAKSVDPLQLWLDLDWYAPPIHVGQTPARRRASSRWISIRCQLWARMGSEMWDEGREERWHRVAEVVVRSDLLN